MKSREIKVIKCDLMVFSPNKSIFTIIISLLNNSLDLLGYYILLEVTFTDLFCNDGVIVISWRLSTFIILVLPKNRTIL